MSCGGDDQQATRNASREYFTLPGTWPLGPNAGALGAVALGAVALGAVANAGALDAPEATFGPVDGVRRLVSSADVTCAVHGDD